MYRLQPRSTLTATRFPYTTLFRSQAYAFGGEAQRYGARAHFDQVRALHGEQAQVVAGRIHGRHQRGRAIADRHVVAHVERDDLARWRRSEEHTSELQSLMRISYAVFCLKKNTHKKPTAYIR